MTDLVLKLYVRLSLIATLGLFVHAVAVAQITDADVRRLIHTGSWSPEEILSLERGEAVVRSLEARDKQELATVGVVRINRLPAITMDMFRRSLDPRSEGSMKTGGRFSQPPALADLNDLELDDETIAQLQMCSLRKCDLNLSAQAIGHLQKTDWKSPHAKQHATQLIRHVLLAYASDYSTRGIAQLGTYDNRRRSVDLAASHQALLQDSTQLLELAPEFSDYLAKYPEPSLADVENTLHWSVVDFGLKPTITLSHAAAYRQATHGVERLFIASRQIYSSRYLDSSLSLAMLLRDAGEEGKAYLLFFDRSRSDALDGPLGRVARGVVRKDASQRVRKMLDKAHIRLLAFAQPQVAVKQDPPKAVLFSWLIPGALMIVSIIALVVALRRLRRPTAKHLGR